MANMLNTNAYLAHYTAGIYDSRYMDYVKVIYDNNFYKATPDYGGKDNFIVISTTKSEEEMKYLFSDFPKARIERITTNSILADFTHLQMFELIERISKSGKVHFNGIDIKKINAELDKRQIEMEEND